MLLKANQVITLDSQHHFVGIVDAKESSQSQLTTTIEPITDGQHPYFDSVKQLWTSEPAKPAVPDAVAMLAAQVASQQQQIIDSKKSQAAMGAEIAQALAAQTKGVTTNV